MSISQPNLDFDEAHNSDCESEETVLSLLKEIGRQVSILAEMPRQLSSLQKVVETSNEKVLDVLQPSSTTPSASTSMVSRRRQGSVFSTARIGSVSGHDSLFHMASEALGQTRRGSEVQSFSEAPSGRSSMRHSLHDIFSGGLILPNVMEEATPSGSQNSSHMSSINTRDIWAKRDRDLTKQVSDAATSQDDQVASADLWIRRNSMEEDGVSQLENEVSMAVASVSRNSRADLSGEPRYCMLAPDSLVKLVWHLIMLVVTIIIGVVVPFNFAYWEFPTLSSGSGLMAAYMVIDVLLVMDVVVRFRTGFKSSSGEGITDVRSVALRYLQTWLLLNLLAAWPVFLLPWNVTVPLAFKLLRVIELQSLLSQIQDYLHHARLTWLKVSLSVFLAAHTMACAWRVVQNAQASDGIDSKPWHTQYVVDIYWVVMTMTTVGYGDIDVIGTAPRLFATVCMLVGAVVFGFILSIVSTGMHRILDDEIGKTLGEVKGFMIYRKISPELQVRVERNIRDALATERKENMRPELFSKLSQAIQSDLSLELLSEVILEFPLFVRQPRNFIAEIARAHNWVRALQGDVVVEEGQLVQELVFVVQGKIMVLEPSENSNSCKHYMLESGGWLGEACLFQTHVVRDHSAVAIKNTELAVLASEAYHSIKQNYPAIVDRYEVLKQEIKKGGLNLNGLSYKHVHLT